MNTHQKTKNRHLRLNPAGIYLLKVNNRNTRTRCEICSKLTLTMQLTADHLFEKGGAVLNFRKI